MTSSARAPVRKERTEAERRELQLWMKQRRAQQMRAYTDKLATLRDKEARPFGSSIHAKTVSCSQTFFIRSSCLLYEFFLQSSAKDLERARVEGTEKRTEQKMEFSKA